MSGEEIGRSWLRSAAPTQHGLIETPLSPVYPNPQRFAVAEGRSLLLLFYLYLYLYPAVLGLDWARALVKFSLDDGTFGVL